MNTCAPRSITLDLSHLSPLGMPPKVKGAALPLDAMATQETQPTQSFDVPDEQDTPAGEALEPQDTPAPAESATPPETPPKRGRPRSALNKNGSSAKKVRAIMASAVAIKIANDLEIHPYVVQRILDSLEKTAVESLKEHGVFRMKLFMAKLRTRKARPAGEQRFCGRDVFLKAMPEKRTLKLLPTKILKQKCM